MRVILKASEIKKSYDSRETILKGINLSIEEESFTTILGPSGSGKSTLLGILSGLYKPSSGEVVFKKKKITKLSEPELARWKRFHVSNIFQDYLLLNNLTVRENIHIGKAPNTENMPFDRIVNILDINTILDKFPSQLSGGQQQRVAIARAVIKKPSIIFCDEATGALDEENSKKVVSLLHDMKKKFGITILFSTHNLEIAKTADRIISIKNGQIAKDEKNEAPVSPEEMVW